MGMRLDEEFGADRVMQIETEDEENEEHDTVNEDDDTGSDLSNHSVHAPFHSQLGPHDSPTWPQSYRRSMDMFTGVTPPSLSFLKGSAMLSSACMRSQTPTPQHSLCKPLISSPSFDREEAPTLNPSKLSIVSSAIFSAPELPPLQQCSYTQSVLNALNALCGIGILSIPYAVKEGGWCSLFLLFLFGIITFYTGTLLKNCLESSPGIETYPDIGQAAFGLFGRIFIAIALYAELYTSCIEYLIMMSDNLGALFPNSHMEFAGIHLDSYQMCAIISTLVILPTVWLRNLSLLSIISAGGVIALIIVVICLLWVGVVDDVGFHPSGTAINIAKLPVTIGLYSFCYGSHSVFPNIYSSMKEPSRFPSVLLISFSTAFFSYFGVAVCGFLMFGEKTNPQFTLNLPAKLVTSKVAAWTVVITPLSKYAITITPVAFGIEEFLPSPQLRTYGVSILIRTLLVFSTLVISLAVPYFGSVMSLIGSSLVMLVSLILPCACYIKLSKDRLTRFQLAACSFIIVVGLISAVVGTYSALTSMA
ncbi:amino acid transporter AVT1D-like [Solanum dulcamara]|uniref:amino acid transporter AVT1D-like n=1 Tax=Solanum dulcamara TaxID=45834 RepID=UPI002485481F|nr:amino acid transporter AVT1D-like [Solanum dulcamara]